MNRFARVSFVLCALGIAACSTSVPAGSERGPCYGNGTCDAPLACLSGLCVRANADGGGIDSAMSSDSAVAVDSVSPGLDVGPLERRSYVVSQLTLPTTSSEASMLAVDLDGYGVQDNQFGHLLAALGEAGASLDIGASTDAALATGALIVLIDVRAASFTMGAAEGRVLEGGDPMPTPCTDATMLTTCGRHLTGSGMFTVTPPIAPLSTTGAITASRLELTAASGRLPLVLASEVIWAPTVEQHVSATVASTGLTTGIFGAAIRSSDVDAIVIPAMFDAISAIIVRDCSGSTGCMSGSSGAAWVGTLDANDDGMVTIDELRTSSLIQSLLAPDLDLFDGAGARGHDGTADSLSMGMGFTAVLATFPSPT